MMILRRVTTYASSPFSASGSASPSLSEMMLPIILNVFSCVWSPSSLPMVLSFSMKRTTSLSATGRDAIASEEGPGCSGDEAEDGELARSAGRSVEIEFEPCGNPKKCFNTRIVSGRRSEGDRERRPECRTVGAH